MKVVLQRVTRGSVTVGGECTGRIGKGIVALAGFRRGDDETKAAWMAKKIAEVRIFPESEEKYFHLSLRDAGGGLLLVPQFTLYGDARKGRRPDFAEAMGPEEARPLFEKFVELCRKEGGFPVETGVFQAHMLVELENDGPVTVILEN